MEANDIAMAERVATLEADVENIKGWQKTQNGTLQRIDGKIDKLVYWLMGTMATVVIFVIGLYVNMKG